MDPMEVWMDNPKLKDYFDDLNDYKKIEIIGNEIISKSAEQCGIKPMQIAHRIKAPDSVAEKLIRKSDKYSCTKDLMDVVGFRVICYFSDQVDLFAEQLAKNLDVDPNQSTDKRKLIEANSFGYLSLHYICSLPKSDSYPDRLCEYKFEIQIRTVLQHTWAEIEHDLGYKTEFGVPREARRNFSRIAGLLEIADQGFVDIKKNLAEYNKLVEEKIHSDEVRSVNIDLISLRVFAKHSEKMIKLNEDIAAISGAVIIASSVEPFIEKLDFFGIKKIGELIDALDSEREHIMTLAREILTDSEVEELTSTVGLYYLCRALLVWGDYNEEQLNEFYKIIIDDEKKRNVRIKRILRQREKYKASV